jgi:BNR/Asp-box repeat
MNALFTRRRAKAAGFVVAFLAAFAALGAVSRSSPTSAGITAASAVPYAPWYWTMAVSPSDANTVLVGTSNGVYRSTDGAKTWHPVGPRGLNTTSLVAAGDAIYIGGVPGPNPVVRNGKGRTAPDGPAVLAESTDGGKTFKLLRPTGLANLTVQALAVDPTKSTTLYALLNDGRLYRSTDGARSFQLVSAKVGISPWAIAVTQGSRFVGGDMDSGGFASVNGKTWRRTPFTDSRGGRMVMEYAVDPSNAADVLMSSVGIERSTDGGKTWHLALKSNVMFGPVAWAPQQSKIAYAVGFDRSFWRSDDGGQTWKPVS